MPIERWQITSRQEWLERRKKNINASEIGALFGCSPYLTRFALYADKAGLADADSPDTEVLRRGRILEPAIAAAVQEQRPDWKIQKSEDYIWSPASAIGCTPDFIVHCPRRGTGVLQGKTAAKPIFDEDWQDGPPQWIVLQTLQEMMLSEVQWGAIAVLVTGTWSIDCQIWEFERHAEAEARIVVGARKFWQDVAAGRKPTADYGRDDGVLKLMFPRDNGETVDLSKDNRMPELLERFEALSEIKRDTEQELGAVKAEIGEKLGEAACARLPGWQVTNKLQHRKETVQKASSFRVLRVKRLAEEKAAA